MSKKLTSEIYPNSPLVEVIFEIRFPGEPVVECRRDTFYELVRKDYPKVFVPSANLGLEPYRFEKEDESSGIMLAINKLSYYSRKYPGFKEFRKEVIKLITSFRKAYPKISKLNRTGFRYVNIIPFTREEGIVPMDKFVNLKIQAPSSIPDKYDKISIGFVSKRSSGSVTTRVESMSAAEKSAEAILLDIDYAKEKNLSISNYRKYLDISHQNARQLFEDLITDRYRMYLRGETI